MVSEFGTKSIGDNESATEGSGTRVEECQDDGKNADQTEKKEKVVDNGELELSDSCVLKTIIFQLNNYWFVPSVKLLNR